jgi:hypothetical protein
MVHTKKLKRKVEQVYKDCLNQNIQFKNWQECKIYIMSLNLFSSKTIINWCAHCLYKESQKTQNSVFEIYLQKIISKKQKLIKF